MIQVQQSTQDTADTNELDLDPSYQIHNITYNSELDGQFIHDSNGQWIELQPLYGSAPSNFVQSVPPTYSTESESPQPGVGGGNGPQNVLPKAADPDPIIEEIIDTQKHPDLRSEIESMVK